MIDVVIWKEKLEQDLKKLQNRLNQLRWSSRSIVLFERDLMLIFFSIRALIEAGKLTDYVSHKEYSFITYPNKGKIVDDYTKFNIAELFDFDSGIEKKITLKLLTHQFIHSYVIFTEFSDDGTVFGILLCSDREKNKKLFRLPINLLIEIIEDVISDEIAEIHMKRDIKTRELRKIKIN